MLIFKIINFRSVLLSEAFSNNSELLLIIQKISLKLEYLLVTYAFLQLPECQGTPCSKQARNLRFK